MFSRKWILTVPFVFTLALIVLAALVISPSQSPAAVSGSTIGPDERSPLRTLDPSIPVALTSRDALLFLTETHAQATISGTISGPSGPVANVWIGAGSDQDWQETTTDANGFYSLAILTEGPLHFHVRPEISTRLAQINLWMASIPAGLTQNFTVTNGYLLDLQPTGGGAPIAGPTHLEVQPLVEQLPDNQWYDLNWDEATQRHRAVLPPDVYYVTARDVPTGYHQTTQAFDLRTADLTADMPFNTAYVHPIPFDPPDASKITIGSTDSLGEAMVTGAPGAALPLAHVLLVNLNATHQAHAISEVDGSFTARIYAPPGSAIMIKHGPASPRWHDLDVGFSEGVNPFPGTIIYVPHTHTGDRYLRPFAAAGAIESHVDDLNTTRNYVASAWAITGTVGPVVVESLWTRAFTGTYDGEMVPGLYLGGLNWTHPTLSDLDNDGDLDLLVGERSGHLVLYRNQGSAASPDWEFATTNYAGVDTGWWAYPALADVTNDGAPDLFVGAGNGTVFVYYNDGTPALPLWPDAPDVSLSAGNNAAPALDDLEGDGDLDLLVGHEGGTLYHFENTGTLADPVWTQRDSSYGGISEAGGLQPAFVDLDGDADRDLLVGLCGQLVWYERDGTPPTWTRFDNDPIGYGSGSCGTSPSAGDWNGDGDIDLVIGEHWGNLRFFDSASPSTWNEQAFPFPFDLAGDSAPALADWDDDGDLDLLIGQAHGQVHQYTNVGNNNSPNWRPDGILLELPWTNHPHPFPTFADIDGDDDYDLFLGEGGWQGPGAGGNIHYYRNDGTPSSPNWTQITTNYLGIDVGGWSTPVFVDIDDDNDLDLFIGDEAGTLTLVENTGTITTPTWATPIQPYAGLHLNAYSAPTFLDLDQDGDQDILIGSESGSLAYVRNTGPIAPSPDGTALLRSWELVTTAYPGIDIGDRSIPTAADINGDGDADLLIGDGDGGLDLYLYAGQGQPPARDTYAPGDLFQVKGTVHLYSSAITRTTDLEAISVHGWLGLMMQHNEAGQPLGATNYFMSTLLTPSGLPIQRSERPAGGVSGGFALENLQYLGGHTIGGEFIVHGQLSDDLLPGIYRPHIWLDFAGVPTSTDWLAANVTYFTFGPNEAALSPIIVRTDIQEQNTPPPNHLIWRLLTDDYVQGTRGVGAREDRGSFELASQITSQGAPYYAPPTDLRSGQPITYRLEPFLPMLSFTDRRMPTPPLIPFDLPGGQLHVVIQEPNGSIRDLGSEAFAQSFNRTKTTRDGNDLNPGTTQLDDVYSLKAASDRFRVTFDQYGHHVITMTGTISDIWGNGYNGGGTYDVWIAQPLDIDPGVLPGTPLAVGDTFNPALQFHPRVPANVHLKLTLYPDSDPAQAITRTLSGRANLYGYFSPIYSSTQSSITLTHPGEYRVDLTATYSDSDGTLYMGTMTWGGVVMTPQPQADLVAHGRRGLDSLTYIPNHWFVSSRDLTIPARAISHSFNPYYNGDILWSRMSDGPYGGDALLLGASVQDTVGTIEAAIQTRFDRMRPELASPGTFDERVAAGELPLFISTRSGQAAQLFLRRIGVVPDEVVLDEVDQIAYSYRYSQRPGVRIRELVTEDNQTGGYWRLDTLYDDQLGVGIQGDQPNDFKFQYVGVVYRDLETGHNEYLGQGSGWVFIPDDDPTGSRVMPPFAGPGNGGWTTEGGPILTLKNEEIHLFILPTGVRPGAVLQVGDKFHFAGHIMPTLNSQVAVTVTAPSGSQYFGSGQANPVGYFYNPDDDFIVNEPGLWSVDVRVWHDGRCSGGQTVPPYPSGDVLGSEDGRYWFYAVPGDNARLNVSAPKPGFLSFGNQVTPITIAGTIPTNLTDAVVDYTISMPGYILLHGQVVPSDNTYQIIFDLVTLHQDFPNLDLTGRDNWEAGLSDTFAIGLLLQGQSGGSTIYRANTITIQGDQVFVSNTPPDLPPTCPNPLVGVSVFGLDSGYTDIEYTLVAQPDPVDATDPITYTWSTDGLVNGQGMTSAIYSWVTTGVHTVSVTAENCGGSVHADHTIALSQRPSSCDSAITGVTIDGPSTGVKDTDYVFTANVAPPTATLPISYTWSANGLINGQGTISTTYHWSQPGVYDVVVSIGNCGGSANDTHPIEIGGQHIYLPVILRNY